MEGPQLHTQRTNFKLDADFGLREESAPLTPALSKGQLYVHTYTYVDSYRP